MLGVNNKLEKLAEEVCINNKLDDKLKIIYNKYPELSEYKFISSLQIKDMKLGLDLKLYDAYNDKIIEGIYKKKYINKSGYVSHIGIKKDRLLKINPLYYVVFYKVLYKPIKKSRTRIAIDQIQKLIENKKIIID